MKTPSFKPLIITSLPVFISVSAAVALVWYLGAPRLVMPFVLDIIAGGLVNSDNRLTGRLKNITVTVTLLSLAPLLMQMTSGIGLPFILTMTATAFCFMLLGATGLRYHTFTFGALAVATYTTLTHTPETFWPTNPVIILFGTPLYSTCALFFHTILPHQPIQGNVAVAYESPGGYFDAKAGFFGLDEAKWLDNRQIDLAMCNVGVTTAFNQCHATLFYQMCGQHRHLRMARMLRYYFVAQGIYERVSSAHADCSELVGRPENTDLIFHIRRLLEMRGQACHNVAESLCNDRSYRYSGRLAYVMEGCCQSSEVYVEQRGNSDAHSLRQLLNNPGGVDHQFRHLASNDSATALENESDAARVTSPENNDLKGVWQTVRSQFNLESSVFRHAVRLSILVAAACTIVGVFRLTLGYQILLTAIFVCQPNYSATESRVHQRIAGIMLGVVVGSLVPYFTPLAGTKLWVVIACTTPFFMSRPYKYNFSTFFITVQALTNFPLAGLDVYSIMPIRIIDTVIDAVLTWAAVSYLRPDWRYLTLDCIPVQTVQSNDVYLRAILDQLRNGSADDVGYRTIRHHTYESTAALNSTLSDMSGNPEKYGSRLQDGLTLLKTGYVLTGNISAPGAYRSQMAQDCGDSFAEGFYRVAYQTTDLPEYMPQTDESAFQTALPDIRAGLEALHGQIPDDRQSYALWQQLSLMIRQFAPCHQALARLKRPITSATANTAKAV